MRYLGIDYGKNKVGLALSEGELAGAWKILDVSGLEDAVEKLVKVIKEEGIDNVVIGKAESGESLKMTNAFIKSLGKVSKVKIIEVDETLSTQRSHKMMKSKGVGKKKRMNDDAYSAAIILQDFLDRENLA